MGAVHFFTPASGVGITSEALPCYDPVEGGSEVALRRQAVRLALTSDGGRSWRVAGAAVPVGSVRDGTVTEEVAALSAADIWALVGRGRVVATDDGGAVWRVEDLPGPVIQIAIDHDLVWALSCPPISSTGSASACRPELWQTASVSGSWRRVGIPGATSQGPYDTYFAGAANDLIVALPTPSSHPPHELMWASHDVGLHWTDIRAPETCGSRGFDQIAALTPEAPHTFWLLCLLGAAAGSSTKRLLRSTDGGATWRTVAAATSLVSRPRPGSIPLEEPSALAAAWPTRLWLSLTNGLAESNDGGRRWVDVRQALDPEGTPSVFDVLNANHVWLLAAGTGLWRTTDGLRWHADGPLHTG